jgi:uncharacterized protein (DUF2336 family)
MTLLRHVTHDPQQAPTGERRGKTGPRESQWAAQVLATLGPQEFDEVVGEHDALMGISSTGLTQATVSRDGFTLDTTIIVNTRSVPVRSLWEGGLIAPTVETIYEGAGLSSHPVSMYRAVFNDRNRSFAITEETYRAMNTAVDGILAPTMPEAASDDGNERLQVSVERMSEDRMSSQEPAVDSRGNVREYHEDTRFPAHTVTVPD